VVAGRTITKDGDRPETAVAERAVREVAAHKDAWAALALREKAALLAEVQRRLGGHAAGWIDAVRRARQISPASIWYGEEWYEVYTVASALSFYQETLQDVARGRSPRAARVWKRPDGRVVARVFPSTRLEWLLFNGFAIDVWMQMGVDPTDLSEETVAALRAPAPSGNVSLVLGAGNVNSIPPLDLLHRLIVGNQVVVLKLNPFNAYMGAVLERIFAPLIDRGYLRIVYGGADVGAFLSVHEGVDEVHVTGSQATYEAITRNVNGDLGERRPKPISGELGGVTPLIVIPGRWSEADLRYQAEQVVTTKLFNNGFNCIGTQVLILHERWPQRDAFVGLVRALMDALPPYPLTYPGAIERRRRVMEAYPGAQPLGDDPLRLLVADVDPETSPDLCRCEEFFGPILAEMALPGATPYDFLRNAVSFSNERLAGTLGVNLIVHPQTALALGSALDEAVARLRYGAIGVNGWCGVIFRMAQAPWGAYHDDEGFGSESGQGMVHNAFLFDRPQKAVLRSSFYPFPRSWLRGDPAFMPRLPWLVTNKRRRQTAERVARFALNPGYRHLPGIFFSALRG